MKSLTLICTILLLTVSCCPATGTDVVSPPSAGTVAAPPPTEAPPAAPAATDTPLLPEPTPTPSQPPLEILSSSSYADDIGWFHIVGEVQNNSDQAMNFVKIVATLYDDAGQITGTGFSYTTLDTVLAAGKSPFSIGFDKWDGTTNYKLQAEGNAAQPPRGDIVILSHTNYTDDIGWLHIQGEVQNNRSEAATFVKIVATLYDPAGNVVGTFFTYTDLDAIPAGGASPFDGATQHWQNFDHYELQVQAD